MKLFPSVTFTLTMLCFIQLNAQNVGIGIATPLAKTHVNQTAAVDGIRVDHSGAAGNSIEINQANATNASSAVWIKNSGTNRAVFAEILNTASISDVIQTDNDGLGSGLFVNQLNTGASSNGILVNHFGTGAAARGVEVDINSAGNTAIGYSLFHTGTGRGSYMDLSNTANGSTGSAIYHSGTGMGAYVGLTNTASTAMGQAISNSGLGRGLQVALGNTANPALGLSVFHSGTGTGVYSQSQGQAVYGLSTGTAGRGGTFAVNNVAANTNTIGLLVVYDADASGGTGDGGNAMEVQHNGSIGNAIEVFMGTPSVAPGPANTTSEYSCISASHMATGTGTAGYKSAFYASVNGGDPAILAFNNGNEVGEGVLSFANPNGTNDPQAVYGFSYEAANPGYGIGVRGVGGYYGVQGWQQGTNFAWCYGVRAEGDMTATGVKSFTIDYPLDPENKVLRHYNIESNEVLNMYRGIIKLDANGQATIELPEYFDAVNINPSYQLTAIGTSTQPYVATEIANNKFTVAGAPNTKVSWTVHAQRNDPTLRYFDANGKDYSNEVFEKPPKMKGKYYNPEAYGQPANMGIHYSKSFQDKLERAKTVTQKAMERPTKKTALPQTAQPDTKKEGTEAKKTTQNVANEEEVTSSK